MNHKLSITVQVDLDDSRVHLKVGGCLTENSWSEVLTLIRRAGALTPSATTTVDLSEAVHIDPAGLTLLRSAVDRLEDDGHVDPVEFRVPAHLPCCAAEQAPTAVTSR